MSGFDERILNGMGVFAAIVDAGSFAAAAEQLGISQPGVSRAIARLEARLGIRLFNRTTRVVSLTDEGRRFHAEVRPLMASLEEAAANASGGATAVRGRLRVNVDPFFSRLILGPQLESFLVAHPELRLELINRDQLGDMVADGFDLAVRFGVPRVSGMVARKLLETRILTVAAPSYLKRQGRPFSPEELLQDKHTCIDFRDSETGRPFTWEFHNKQKKIVIEPRARLTVNDSGTLLSTCIAGYGIAQIMEYGCAQLISEGLLVDLFGDWPDERFPLYALYPSRHHPPAKTRVFLDFVIALTGAQPMPPMPTQ
jgi:DNA-binding transcriptional LysR family regulator